MWNKLALIREHHKGPIAIGDPVLLNYLGPPQWFCRFWYETWGFFLPLGWICHLHVCSCRLFFGKCVLKNALQSKGNSEVIFKRPNLDSIFRRLPSGADVCFIRPCRRLFSLLPDSLYLAQIFFTLSLLQLRCNYMFLNPIIFEPDNLNVIPISSVYTGSHNYNAQTNLCMITCKTYVDNMWHSLKDLKSC